MGRQQSRTHGKCRQRNGNPKEKKKQKELLESKNAVTEIHQMGLSVDEAW